MSPDEVKARLPQGLLGFPLTDFNAGDSFDAAASRRRMQWLMSYGASAFFVAGGAGEFFSLDESEYADVLRVAVETCGGRLPVIGASGFGTRRAIAYARESERLGADGILLLPPYLVESPQAGLRAHIEAVCKATRLAVIVYNRANCRLAPDTLAALAETCPNLIAFKDGVGDIEQLAAIRTRLGARMLLLNGMPTAETYARAFRALGFATYSSAVFNFAPKTAIAFHRAIHAGDDATVDRLMADFFEPYIAIRKRQPGYAVSIVKAGARIVGRDAGKVRPPLADLADGEYRDLARLIEKLGPQD
jgi:5-dehydro-4-deoxyglucarate dehydratase